MSAPQVDTKPPVAGETTPETSAQLAQGAQTNEHTVHEPMVDTSTRSITAQQSLTDWWNEKMPRGARTALTQVGITLAVVLVMLPLASALGWFGLRTAAPSSASTGSASGQTAVTSNSPSPNAPAHQLYDAQVPPALQGGAVDVKLVAKEALVSIAPGIAYQAWTFNGTVPGPVIHVRQGQTVNFTLTNATNMSHSIDFHAAQTPWNINYQPVAPGQSFSFSWKADYPGVFMYHCGTPPVMVHMANGMYGAVIVDPANGWAAPAQEYVLVQSEFYVQRTANGTYTLDTARMMNSDMPNYVVFNGYANQYTQSPLTVQAGQRVRLFIVNVGPSHFSAFHVIGAIFSDTYADGNPANHMQGNQTITIPPGGGSVVELTIPEAGEYPFLTHSFMDASMGALGMIKATP